LAAACALSAPVHLYEPNLDIGGLDHSCGVAMDSQGDMFVSSAEDSKVDIYDQEHKMQASINDANEPCGLAVDSQGRLFVSDAKTGNVVRFTPVTYPFSGTPVYGPPATIDSSGEARGIALDSYDDRLYVAKGTKIDSYNPDGTLGVTEVQRVLPFEAEGGTYKLSFEGVETSPIPYQASHAEVQAALEGLSTVGPGNVSVTEGLSIWEGRDHIITFASGLAHTDVKPIGCDTTGLKGTTPRCFTATNIDGFSGHIGEGSFSDVSGVGVYTYKVDSERADRYVFAGDSGTGRVEIFTGPDVRTLHERDQIDGSETPDGSIGFGPGGAGIGVDRGNTNPTSLSCAPVAEQACTSGHLFLYDDLHGVVDEFEADGRYLTQIKLTEADAGFTDARPSAIAVNRSKDSDDGTIYVTSGAGLGAQVLAFGPLPAPSRLPLDQRSLTLKHARSVATDSVGDMYVVADSEIHVYDQNDKELTKIEDASLPTALAVDSRGAVYVVDGAGKQVTYYTPSSYPPAAGTGYERHQPVLTLGDLNFGFGIRSVAVDPATDHVFVGGYQQILELESAAEGSAIRDHCFACDVVSLEEVSGIDVYGANGDVYISSGGKIYIVDKTGKVVLARVNGGGGAAGPFLNANVVLAVDQSNGHFVAFDGAASVSLAEEFDAGGAFIAQLGEFGVTFTNYGVAIDNAQSSPNHGNVYVALDELAPNTFDLTAFGPLAYGEPPEAVTGAVSGLGGTTATLNGTVAPRGFDLTACRFEYVSEPDFQAMGFSSAQQAFCTPDILEIGKGDSAVSVHADVEGLVSSEHYRFRLVGENKYGRSVGATGVFGRPIVTTSIPIPLGYTEAGVHGSVNPSGVATTYRFEYGESNSYGKNTPASEVAGDSGLSGADATIAGLKEGTAVHYRLVAVNEAGETDGPDQILTTLARRGREACPNVAFRGGSSANLPDCRAYELVTPAETAGAYLYSTGTGNQGSAFNQWLTVPRGEGVHERLSFRTGTTLPGFEGTGRGDSYTARRGAGEHPVSGWSSSLVGPSLLQAGGGVTDPLGVASDQQYSFLGVTTEEVFEGTLPHATYLFTPEGFEPVGKGDLGSDLHATSKYVSAAGAHVIFTSSKYLELGAPQAGTTAIYDRAAGSASAQVVSVDADGAAFGAGEDATYLGSSGDGAAIAFDVKGRLYLHRIGGTVQIADSPYTFGGISEDGKRVFYTATTFGTDAANLFVCDVDAGGCVGPSAHAATEIAQQSVFVEVSPDGSHVFFTSRLGLDSSEEAIPGADNLYVWDTSGETRFIAILGPNDFVRFDGDSRTKMGAWTEAIGPSLTGRGKSPVRSTPDGRVFVFESHARLGTYDNHGFAEVYRYDPAAGGGERVVCLSCDPTGDEPSADASLQTTTGLMSVEVNVANVTDDGEEVFFQSSDRLLPEDVNNVQDIYEWKASGSGGCARVGGCLALISSGQGESNNYLYSMSADGHDVFLYTLEVLLPLDVPGSRSIYDARIDGGIPDQPPPRACQGDACQGQPSQPPDLASPLSLAAGEGNVRPTPPAAAAGNKRSLSRRQLLARALKTCKHRPIRRRHRCQTQARKRYGAVASKGTANGGTRRAGQ
jgi:hypothetical protein